MLVGHMGFQISAQIILNGMRKISANDTFGNVDKPPLPRFLPSGIKLGHATKVLIPIKGWIKHDFSDPKVAILQKVSKS